MKVYVVVNTQMEGKHPVAIFSTHEKAQRFLKTHQDVAQRVEEFTVIGTYEYPNPLFTANAYLQSPDVHYLRGIYATYEAADQAAGPNGIVMSQPPDVRE